MVDLSVRYVSQPDLEGGAPASGAGAGRPLVGLTLARPGVPATPQEQTTSAKPGRTGHELRVSILGSSGTSVTDIDVQDGPGQLATARLQVTGPRGASVIEVQVGQGSIISVRIGRPRRSAPPIQEVARSEDANPAASPSDDGRVAGASDTRSQVPIEFRRAFDSERPTRRGDD